MKRNTSKTRRKSTAVRDNQVHEIYHSIMDELGDLSAFVSKGYIYERIQQQTRLSVRTIAFILNHTQERVIMD